MNDIKRGTTLYKFRNGKYIEVEVYDIYLERYISGYKTIIKVSKKVGELKFIETHFASDIGNVLLTQLPKEELEEEKDG